MRWSRVWVVAPLVAGLALACGSDVVEDDIIGTWNATEFVFSNFDDPVVDFDVIDAGGDLSVVIRADGTYTLTVSLPFAEPEVINGDWVLNGDVLTMDASGWIRDAPRHHCSSARSARKRSFRPGRRRAVDRRAAGGDRPAHGVPHSGSRRPAVQLLRLRSRPWLARNR